MTSFEGGGSTLGILRWYKEQIWLKSFSVIIWNKRIFMVDFRSIGHNFRPQNHKCNFKTWENFGWKFKKSVFFLIKCGSRCHIVAEKQKYNFESFIWSFIQILGLIIVSNTKKMNFEENSHSNMAKNVKKKKQLNFW